MHFLGMRRPPVIVVEDGEEVEQEVEELTDFIYERNCKYFFYICYYLYF